MNAFDLRFEALEPGLNRAVGAPPEITLSKPDAGWIRLRLRGDDVALVVRMSYLYPPFVSLWAWTAAIAHHLFPVTVRIVEEGLYTELCAEQEDEAVYLKITIRQFDANGQESDRFIWHEKVLDWLKRTGVIFGRFFQDTFEKKEWRLGERLWPEPGHYVPWEWPCTVMQRLAPAQKNDWPLSVLRAWFFMTLARQLDPYVLRTAWCPDDQEKFVRLQYLLAMLRHEALNGAWTEMDSSTLQRSCSSFVRCIQETKDLLEELEMLRESGTPTRPELTDRLFPAALNFGTELHGLERETMKELFARLPPRQEKWLIDEQGRPGRIAFNEGHRLVIDWGEFGFTTEYGFHCGFRSTWRWPVREPRNFIAPDTPLFRRWRIFSISPQTMQFHICPCCGYPHLECEEPVEIQDCPLCGWPLYLTLHTPLPHLDQPLIPENLPALRVSRQHFDTHGDAFSPADSMSTTWLRRHDVAALRKQVIAQFESWLADPLRDTHPLFQEDWWRLK